jgi:hypothetical protein
MQPPPARARPSNSNCQPPLFVPVRRQPILQPYTTVIQVTGPAEKVSEIAKHFRNVRYTKLNALLYTNRRIVSTGWSANSFELANLGLQIRFEFVFLRIWEHDSIEFEIRTNRIYSIIHKFDRSCTHTSRHLRKMQISSAKQHTLRQRRSSISHSRTRDKLFKLLLSTTWGSAIETCIVNTYRLIASALTMLLVYSLSISNKTFLHPPWRTFQRRLRNLLRCHTLSPYIAHPTSQRLFTTYILLELSVLIQARCSLTRERSTRMTRSPEMIAKSQMSLLQGQSFKVATAYESWPRGLWQNCTTFQHASSAVSESIALTLLKNTSFGRTHTWRLLDWVPARPGTFSIQLATLQPVLFWPWLRHSLTMTHLRLLVCWLSDFGVSLAECRDKP